MKALILAGGESSRMLTDKSMLEIDGVPLFARAIALATHAQAGEVYLSARLNSAAASQSQVPVLYDEHQNIGPAAALLRAHKEAPLDDWLVLACDFPNASALAIDDLRARHEKNEAAEITCYMHEDGSPEPLFAIWSPIALARLHANVKTGRTGPMMTLTECETQMLKPRERRLLYNTNTPQEWADREL